MGNFAVAPLRDAGLTDDQLDFHQFPAITAGVAMAEDAPTDTFHIAANAQNKDNARAFLRYLVLLLSSNNHQQRVQSWPVANQLSSRLSMTTNS